jgi:two-component system chemotaxis sensor kinase CheA
LPYVGGAKMGANWDLKKKISIIFTAAFLFVIFLSGGIAIDRGSKLTKKLLSDQTYLAALKVSQSIDPTKLKDVIEGNTWDNAYYEELHFFLREMKDYLQLEYLYIMTKNKEGVYLYIVDGLTKEDEDFSGYGAIEYHQTYFQNFEKAMQGQTVYADFHSTKEWGTLVSSYIPIRDQKGVVIAFLGSDLDAAPLLKTIHQNTWSMILFMGIIFVIAGMGTVLFSIKVTKPLLKLQAHSLKIARGETCTPFLVNSKDEFKDLAVVMNNRIHAIQNFLEAVGQGFLSFGEDLVISSECSLECKKIFGKNIANIRFPQLIYEEDQEQRNFLYKILGKILQEEEEIKKNIYITLLPEELLINQRYIKMEYKLSTGTVIDERLNPKTVESILVILTDVTDQRVLENRMEKERNLLKMAIKTVVHYNDFINRVREYENFCKYELQALLEESKGSKGLLEEVFRHTHNFKGLFSQFDMSYTTNRLHEFETFLSDLKKNMQGISDSQIVSSVLQYNLMDCLVEDMYMIKQLLGENFFRQKAAIMIEPYKLIELEKKIISLLPPMECKLLLPDLRRLRHRSIKELLKTYPEYTMQLAEDLGKPIAPFEIQGEDIILDAEIYQGFIKSLVHVFRNMVDHGLENPEIRAELGKSELGAVQCYISKRDHFIEIIIEDDGCGIDQDIIRTKAAQMDMEKVKDMLWLRDPMQMIFEQGFSTKDQITKISGRGIGLSVVKAEIEKLEGKIQVESQRGIGTKFIFSLPLEAEIHFASIPATTVMEVFKDTVVNFLLENMGITTIGYENAENDREERLLLKETASMIRVTGVLNGQFILSADKKLATVMVRSFMMEELTAEEEVCYIGEVLAECANIVVGNSLQRFEELEDFIRIESPIMIYCREAWVKFPQSHIKECVIETSEGTLRLYYAAAE